jgi:putative PEP-CTERM system TPR-repeat lipoprotein
MPYRIVLRVLPLAFILGFVLSCRGDAEATKRAYLTSGDEYVRQKNYGAAIVEYRNALRQDQMFGQARSRLAKAYAASGDLARAYREAVRAADLLPADGAVQLEAVRYLLATGQFEDAATRAQRVLARQPDHVEAHVLYGAARAGLRDFDGALQQIEGALALDPGRAATHTNLAMLQLAHGDRDAARASFERALQLDPRSLTALLALAMFQWSVGEITEADATLQRVVAIDPGHVPAHRALAALYMATGRVGSAERHLMAIAEITRATEARFALADYYVLARKPELATKVLTPLLAPAVTFAGAQVRLAHVAYVTRDVERAHRMLDEVLQREPKSTSALLLKAQWLWREGRLRDALARASLAVAAAPESQQGHYLLGVLRASLRDMDGAAQSFREVLRLNPRAAAAQLQLSRVVLMRGAADEAVQLAEAALMNAPANVEARLSVANALIARNELPRAATLVDALLKEYPDRSGVHLAQGSVLLARRDLAGARQSFQRAIELDPRSIGALTGLTSLDVREGRLTETRARIETKLAAAPDNVAVLLLAVRVFLTAGDARAAETAVRRAIDLAPSETEAYGLLAQAYVAQGKLAEAKAELDRVVARRPRDVSSRVIAAVIAQAQNDLADAKKRYEEILQLDPAAAVAANNLARIYADENGDLDRALRLGKRATDLLPDNAQAHDTLGWVYLRKNLPTLAIPALERSVVLDPGSEPTLYRLAFAYSQAGNAERSRAVMQRVLELQRGRASVVTRPAPRSPRR